jgi:hypothetical protein
MATHDDRSDEQELLLFARTLHTRGLDREMRTCQALCKADPYDRAPREKLAAVLFNVFQQLSHIGSAQRGRLLLRIIGASFPIRPLVDAYFANLQCLFEGRQKLQTPGVIAIGVGSGRCGSTSLTALLARIQPSCCTHENPPLIYWAPLPGQLDFHIRRMKFLSEYVPLVFDAAHWWFNVVARFLSEFPNGRVIGLHRAIEPCIRSFAKVKGSGFGSLNHWVSPNNGIWANGLWDPTYPTFPMPETSRRTPDEARAAVIRRYVLAYNAGLQSLAIDYPRQILLVATEQLSESRIQERMFAFLGVAGKPAAIVLNCGTTRDGIAQNHL